MQDEIITRFKKLFRGNPEAFGTYHAKSNSGETVKKPPQLPEYEAHLFGQSKGLGIIPVIDHEVSWFGVLDYDNHKKIDGVNLIKLEKAVKKLGAPFVVCRSKSGGAHLYMFGSKPLNTKILRQTLFNYADQLKGFGEVEIEVFPKQDRVDKHMMGNWINLPYFTCEQTQRYAIIDGKKAGIREFLSYSESIAINNTMLLELGSETHKDAPPCLEIMYKEKLGEGQRNVALYNWCVYTKKAFPENYETLVYKFNAENFTTPLKHDEVTNVINSVTRGEAFRYKCSEEPCKSRCNSSKCVMRKWGITPSERSELLMTELPELGKLKKFLTDPVQYELEIEGRKLKLNSIELLNFHQFRRVVFEQLDKVIKVKKPEVWMDIVDGLVKKVELIEVPDDASRGGIIRGLLLEYIKQANLRDSGKDMEKRRLITSGKPVVQLMNDRYDSTLKTRYVVFRGSDFRKYIQSKKLGNISGSDVWMSIKDMGAITLAIRDREQGPVKVWGVPLLGDSTQPDVRTDEFDMAEVRNDRTKKPDTVETQLDYSDVPDAVDIDTFKPEF